MNPLLESVSDYATRAGQILRDIGFGVHESQIILALSSVERATVSELSTVTGIHHANLYSVLSALEDRGIVVVVNEDRPKIFEMAPLSHLKEQLSTKVDQLIKDLKSIQKERTSHEVMPTLIYTIRGRAEVEAKFMAMLNKATQHIILVAPDLEMLGTAILDALNIVEERGLDVRMILGENPPIQVNKADIRIKEDTLAVNLVIDSKEALISMPDLSVCGWADNELISFQLEGFLEQTWNIAKER